MTVHGNYIHGNYINGAWAEAAEPAPNINPSNVKDVVGEYARASEAQVRAAIAAARAAFPAWSRGPVQACADMLDRIGNEILARKEELGVLLSREEHGRYAVEFYTTVKTAYVNA